MSLVQIRCPQCRKRAIGTVETTGDDEGVAEFDGYDAAAREFAYTGNSTLTFNDGCYDSDTVTDKEGNPLLECENGHHFPFTWVDRTGE